MSIPQFNVSAADNNTQDRLQHFSLVPDNLNDCNLNFTISAGLAGCNRGTLQSNIPPSLLPYLQRFPHLDGANVPFFIGAATPTAPQLENHHQLTPTLFDGSWQLCYADGSHHSDQKGKGKN
ncbi:transcription factor PCF6-like [Momordica charantia]|uniref:Transcription factor PCF6-like n=1 Tax=Momordica charantia TaxID=3673 RepID=A0A6J1CHI9_MOMCH|nr:transcription factor PCF6-like [Momordica charantia]